MEKYMTNLRIILCANSTSRLIAPIKSRCLLIRVAAPSHEEMLTVLSHVAKRAGAGSLPEDVAGEIITDANGNMRKAILVFEAMKMQSSVFHKSLLEPVRLIGIRVQARLVKLAADRQTRLGDVLL
jgi:replication factor C subunit 3/5